jgi:hypothetical protein
MPPLCDGHVGFDRFFSGGAVLRIPWLWNRQRRSAGYGSRRNPGLAAASSARRHHSGNDHALADNRRERLATDHSAFQSKFQCLRQFDRRRGLASWPGVGHFDLQWGQSFAVDLRIPCSSALIAPNSDDQAFALPGDSHTRRSRQLVHGSARQSDAHERAYVGPFQECSGSTRRAPQAQ